MTDKEKLEAIKQYIIQRMHIKGGYGFWCHSDFITDDEKYWPDELDDIFILIDGEEKFKAIVNEYFEKAKIEEEIENQRLKIVRLKRERNRH